MAYGASTNIDNTHVNSSADLTTIPEPLGITIGVELEFILAVSTYPEKAGFENANPSEAYSLVRHALSQPMTAVCATCGAKHVFMLQTQRNGGIDSENKYGYWEVEDDGSLFLTKDEETAWSEDGKYFHTYEIEIQSRILHAAKNFVTTAGDSKTRHVHEINYVEEINAVINRLHEAFSGPNRGDKLNKVHMVLNEKCGLHVHVGNETRGFPLPTVKKVMSTYVANERAIDNLHAASRIGGSRLATMPLDKSRHDLMQSAYILQPQAYNPPWSSYLVALAHELRRQRLGYGTTRSCLPRPTNNDPWVYPETHLYDKAIGKSADSFHVSDWLTIIDNAPTLRDLKNLQGQFLGRPTVNLNNLGEHEIDSLMRGTFDDEPQSHLLPKPMTIEFRQHAGSLNSTEINAWIDVVVSMVHHAHFTPDADYHDISRNEWLQPNHSSINLLDQLGCSTNTIKFYKTRLTIGQQPTLPNASIFTADIADVDLFPADAMIAPLLEYVAWKRQQDYHPRAVQDRIKEKFRMGGYGKFSDTYLDQLPGFDLYDPHFGLRGKLSTDQEKREVKSRW